MNDPGAVRERLVDGGVVAVLRGVDREGIEPVASAIVAGGVTAIEVTADDPAVEDRIAAAGAAVPDDVVVGVGTVTEPGTVDAAIDAGAEFVVSPHTDPAVVSAALERDALVAPGVMTPTELVEARRAGATLCKVFPAATVGPGHLGALAGPFGDVELMPTGGITAENVGAFVRAGAVAVGAGSALVDDDAIETGAYDRLTDRAERFVEAVATARAE